MTTILLAYLIIGIIIAIGCYQLGSRYRILYWLVGSYFPLTVLFSLLFWPIFLPFASIAAFIDFMME